MSNHAFPQEGIQWFGEGNTDVLMGPFGGLTKREYAAIHIAAGIAASAALVETPLARVAVEQADALLAELEKEKP